MALELLVIVVSYLLGSVSFSVLLAKLLKGIDIRQYGSGNAGATNTLRVLGKGPAILVLLLDVLKGVAAVWLGTWVGGWGTWVPALCGIAAIIGHNWPLYFRFRGGKALLLRSVLWLRFVYGQRCSPVSSPSCLSLSHVTCPLAH